MDRGWTFGFEHGAAVSVDESFAVRVVLRTARRERTELGTDAALGRAVHQHAILRCAQNDRRAQETGLRRQSETSPAITAADGTGSDLSETKTIHARLWPSHLPIPVTQRRDHSAESSLVERYNVYPAAKRFHLSGGGDGLVQPVRAQLGDIDEHGCGILLLGAGMGATSRPSRNLQHRSGSAVHQRSIHQPVGGAEYPDQHGRPWPRVGQRFCRTAMENGEIRRCLFEGLQRSSRRGSKSWTVLPVLQSTAASSSVELSNAGSCLSKIGVRPKPQEVRKDAASRRLLLMSFKRHKEIYPNDRGAGHKTDASAHRSDEFPAGYSLTGCSPAAAASASPAGVEYASALTQVRGSLSTKDVTQKTDERKTAGSQSTLRDQFFCPKNGETLSDPTFEVFQESATCET